MIARYGIPAALARVNGDFALAWLETDIAQVPTAVAVRFDPAGQITRHRYWTLTDQADFTDAEAELAEAYRERLLDAVARR